MSTILLIEDELDIRELLVFALKRAGFAVVAVRDASAGLMWLSTQLPDIALIDWMLPGMSGRDLVKCLRADPSTQKLPLIMLTAKAEEANKLEGFQAGVDDYITKPFSVSELTARIKALLRRTGKSTGDYSQLDHLQFGDLVLDIHSHQILFKKQPISVTPIEYKLLELLMRNPNRAYSRSQLLDKVWGHNVYLEERTVDVHIRRLRKSLTSSGVHRWIHTVRGMGYRFSPPAAAPQG